MTGEARARQAGDATTRDEGPEDGPRDDVRPAGEPDVTGAAPETGPETAPEGSTTPIGAPSGPDAEGPARADLAEAGARAAPHQAQGGASAPALGRNPEVEESGIPPHEPGSMDITAHERTYQSFVRLTIRSVVAILVVLILLALLNA